MEPPDLKAKVENWLNRTGYPLEMRIAQVFKSLDAEFGWYSEANLRYVDAETGKIREVDLRAFCMPADDQVDDIAISVDIDLECKSTTTPWVVLRNSFREQPIHPLIDIGGFSTICVRNQQSRWQLGNFEKLLGEHLKGRLPLSPVPGYSVVEAFRDKGGNDAAFLATRQVVDAMEDTAARFFESEPEVLGLQYLLPTVVTTSPLFEAALDPATGEVVTRQVSRSAVNVPTRRRGEAVVSIVHEAAIDSFMADIKPFNREVQSFLKIFDHRILNRVEGVTPTTGPWAAISAP